MKISRRTLIIAAIGLLLIVAAFFSLYMEKEQEIKDLESFDLDEDQVKQKTTRTRNVKKEEVIPDAVIIDANETIDTKVE